MVLFDDVIQIFDLTDFDVGLMFRVVTFERRRVGAALVDRNLLGNTVLIDRLMRRNRNAALRSRLAVNKKSTVPPVLSTARYKYFRHLTFTYVSSIRQLKPTGTLAGAKLLIQQRHVFDHPAIERGMVDFDAALFHHFFKLPIADPDRPHTNGRTTGSHHVQNGCP